MKRIILLFCTGILLFSCSETSKSKEVESSTFEKKTYVKRFKYDKVEIVNGKLRYGDKDRPIEDLGEFLEMYTDKELKSVQELLISNSKITEIKSLDRVSHIISLAITDSHISKIENLDILINLKNLGLSANKIEVIENLGNLPNLKQLDLSDNPLMNLDGLLELKGMTHISIYSSIKKTNQYYTNKEFGALINAVEENNKETLSFDNLQL